MRTGIINSQLIVYFLVYCKNKIKKCVVQVFKRHVILLHLLQLIPQIFIKNLTFYIFRAVVLYTQAFLRLIAQMLHVSAENHSLLDNPGDKTSMTRFLNTTFYAFYVILTLILRRSRTGTVWFYTSTSNKRAARPKLYTKSLTKDLKRMYSPLTLVGISINL